MLTTMGSSPDESIFLLQSLRTTEVFEKQDSYISALFPTSLDKSRKGTKKTSSRHKGNVKDPSLLVLQYILSTWWQKRDPD